MDTIQTIPDLLRCSGSAQSVTVNLTDSTKALIAAAPDMKDMLVWNAAKISDFMNKVPAESPLWKEMQKSLLSTMEAIAKAEPVKDMRYVMGRLAEKAGA